MHNVEKKKEKKIRVPSLQFLHCIHAYVNVGLEKVMQGKLFWQSLDLLTSSFEDPFQKLINNYDIADLMK